MVTPSVLALACAAMANQLSRASAGPTLGFDGSWAGSCALAASSSQRAPMLSHAALQLDTPFSAISDQIHRLPGGGGDVGGSGGEGGVGGMGGGEGGGGSGASSGG
jgi:hypothetical protein